MPVPAWLWVVFTLIASASQVARNAMQKELTVTLGTVGATHVRFLYGLPFAVLFLSVQLVATGAPLPPLNALSVLWTALGALAQVVATALLLAAMRERSFVVATALIKIEPVWVALQGIILLGEHLGLGQAAAILFATAGVLLMSWPRGTGTLSARPIVYGVLAGGLFGLASIGFRGGIQALAAPQFVVGATTVLVLALALQTVTLTGYLVLRDRAGLAAIFRAWRPSLFAGFMGAFGSQFWFLAFAVETAARVRTLALVEVLFAQVLTRRVFRERVRPIEATGIGLILLGVGLLLNL
ncbi:MAG: EamA/RhaT family transporter [Alphaproteobacteria bacterium]|nr:EamA/RhaT family transporter [Alphaproteobacteria bacterium]